MLVEILVIRRRDRRGNSKRRRLEVRKGLVFLKDRKKGRMVGL